MRLNDKIRSSESAFDSISSVDVEIDLLQGKMKDGDSHKSKLEQEIRDGRFDEHIREKTIAIRQREAEKDKINAELSALNRQADSRAQLAIKRTELQSKKGQVSASYVRLVVNRSS